MNKEPQSVGGAELERVAEGIDFAARELLKIAPTNYAITVLDDIRKIVSYLSAQVEEEKKLREAEDKGNNPEPQGLTSEDEGRLALPAGMTRQDAIDSLWELRNVAVQTEARRDSSFVRWPDMDALLDHIDHYGFPSRIQHPKGEDVEKGNSASGACSAATASQKALLPTTQNDAADTEKEQKNV